MESRLPRQLLTIPPVEPERKGNKIKQLDSLSHSEIKDNCATKRQVGQEVPKFSSATSTRFVSNRTHTNLSEARTIVGFDVLHGLAVLFE